VNDLEAARLHELDHRLSMILLQGAPDRDLRNAEPVERIDEGGCRRGAGRPSILHPLDQFAS